MADGTGGGAGGAGGAGGGGDDTATLVNEIFQKAGKFTKLLDVYRLSVIFLRMVATYIHSEYNPETGKFFNTVTRKSPFDGMTGLKTQREGLYGWVHPIEIKNFADFLMANGVTHVVDPYASKGYYGAMFVAAGMYQFSSDVKPQPDSLVPVIAPVDAGKLTEWYEAATAAPTPVCLIVSWPDPEELNNGVRTLRHAVKNSNIKYFLIGAEEPGSAWKKEGHALFDGPDAILKLVDDAPYVRHTTKLISPWVGLYQRK